MPAWLQSQLERGAKVTIVNRISHQGQLVRLELVANETRGVLSVLAQLCEQDNMLAKVYLCHPGVQHVFKMAKEGGFCGYRNIQMMVGDFLGWFNKAGLTYQDFLCTSSPISRSRTFPGEIAIGP